MININEINNRQLKKILGLKQAKYRYHNKNKSGGNFGINFHHPSGNSYELCGRYRNDGTLTDIRFGKLWSMGRQLITIVEDYNHLIEIMKKVIEK